MSTHSYLFCFSVMFHISFLRLSGNNMLFCQRSILEKEKKKVVACQEFNMFIFLEFVAEKNK